MNAEDEHQPDLFSDVSDLDLVRQLLADLHDNLPGKVSRFRQITDLGRELGRSGTMLFGGHSALMAWTQAVWLPGARFRRCPRRRSEFMPGMSGSWTGKIPP